MESVNAFLICESVNFPPGASQISCLSLGGPLPSYGVRCSVDEQCTEGAMRSVSHCVEGACRCFPNYTYILGEYFCSDCGDEELAILSKQNDKALCRLLAVNLDDPCLNNISVPIPGVGVLPLHSAECKNIPYSKCISGKCACREDATPSRTQPVKCVLATEQIGLSCRMDASQCDLLPDAFCDEDLTCQCPDLYVPNEQNNGCIPKVNSLNENCLITESKQCQAENSMCRWTNQDGANITTCQCITGFVESKEEPNTCVQVGLAIGGPCNESIHCTSVFSSNSDCVKNQCQCKSDSVHYNKQCYPIVDLGEKCFFNGQCNPSSSAISDGTTLSCALDHLVLTGGVSRCSCPKETVEENGRCVSNMSSLKNIPFHASIYLTLIVFVTRLM